LEALLCLGACALADDMLEVTTPSSTADKGFSARLRDFATCTVEMAGGLTVASLLQSRLWRRVNMFAYKSVRQDADNAVCRVRSVNPLSVVKNEQRLYIVPQAANPDNSPPTHQSHLYVAPVQ
jgi:hypothetical protein